eukprot:gene16282-biopygen4569
MTTKFVDMYLFFVARRNGVAVRWAGESACHYRRTIPPGFVSLLVPPEPLSDEFKPNQCFHCHAYHTWKDGQQKIPQQEH